jgi:predicted nucleic acid-binding protein
MADAIIINTGPLVALTRMEALDVAGRLPFTFACPQEVRDELDEGVLAGHPRIEPSWLQVRRLRDPLSPVVLSTLDRGEAAVIQLALENQISLVCIDEWKGRRAALASGLKVTGVLGLLAKAKRLGLVPALRPLIDRAVARGVRYHPFLIEQILKAVGE